MSAIAFTVTRHAAITIIGILCVALVAACSGVPLTSIPRLLRLNGQLLDAKPAEFMVAVQLDARMVPAPGGVPVMEVVIEQIGRAHV